jgi:hypothetical protein
VKIYVLNLYYDLDKDRRGRLRLSENVKTESFGLMADDYCIVNKLICHHILYLVADDYCIVNKLICHHILYLVADDYCIVNKLIYHHIPYLVADDLYYY